MLIVLTVLAAPVALAQDVPSPPPLPAQQQARFENAAMGVLGGWALGNMATGATGWAMADGDRNRGFHQANLAWNAVNLGIAGAGVYGATRVDWQGMTPAELDKRQRNMRTAFLVNGGLDVG